MATTGCIAGAILAVGESDALEARPRVGVEFEHFGQEYRVTDDRDTVTTINDVGVVFGLALGSAARAASRSPRLRLDTSLFVGRQADRARLTLQGEARRGENLFVFDQEVAGRRFRDEGDYSLSSDSFTENARVAWERDLGEDTSVRVQEEIEYVHYIDPDEYNLISFQHRPGIAVRRSFGIGGEARAAYRFGVRDLPDSSALNSKRHTGEFDLGLFLGDATLVDLAARVDRRIYDDGSPRQSSWEHRADAQLERPGAGRFGARGRGALEVVHYDEADELDFDFTRIRLAAGPVWNASSELEIALAPVGEHVFSKPAPAEKYVEYGVELGVEWRRGAFWVSLTDEIARRNYQVEATGEEADPASEDELPESEGLYSDSVTNRLTLLLAADLSRSATFRLFANWEPENHTLARDDAESRIISGGVEYRF